LVGEISDFLPWSLRIVYETGNLAPLLVKLGYLCHGDNLPVLRGLLGG
jgi:hypothetical protein